ncbi:uncharacterized protein LOC120711781 isoform X2 [Panicum virgatum]|uniref:uncharacterized protein LOC120711781 isoform X2 n=1 Tax=Panicum virgatum TaxID=38727 RepID=UPI0019D59AD7|nr:uncharacterized protein LOC120711781 isoform X2 [Panicum virgatum]
MDLPRHRHILLPNLGPALLLCDYLSAGDAPPRPRAGALLPDLRPALQLSNPKLSSSSGNKLRILLCCPNKASKGDQECFGKICEELLSVSFSKILAVYLQRKPELFIRS